MADGIYIGMTAAAARAAQLEAVADNLSNAESPGFKATRAAFQAFLPPSAAGDKILSGAVATGVDLRPGVTVPTDEPLDVVPDGDTFLAVETGDGAAYTRNGHIQLDGEGRLLVAGRSLLDAVGNPLAVPPGAVVSIETNGDVVADGAVVGRLGLFRLNGPVSRDAAGLLRLAAGADAQAVEGTVRTGELELGNAPVLESAVEMINAQRNFETAMQAIQTYRKLDERAIELGRVR